MIALGGFLILAFMLGWLWCAVFVASDADDESMRAWDRQQAEWRGDDRR